MWQCIWKSIEVIFLVNSSIVSSSAKKRPPDTCQIDRCQNIRVDMPGEEGEALCEVVDKSRETVVDWIYSVVVL